jgi:hypothetical protein
LYDYCAQTACVPGPLMVCTNGDQCNYAGTCNPDTGQCSLPTPKTNGTDCNDGNACTQGDRCQQGECSPGAPIVCPGGSPCVNSGTCDPQTGLCSPSVPKPDGAGCDDGNGCTLEDHCQQGVCVAGAPRACTNGDQCRNAGVCNPQTGQCSLPVPKPNGTLCNDGNACTLDDVCEQGDCTAGSPLVCANGGPCSTPGDCNPETGLCSDPIPKPDGTACDDGDRGTRGDVCHQGECAGTGIPDCLRWHEFVLCFEGPDVPVEPVCVDFDLNRDGFVDLMDVAEFMLLPNQP